MITCLKHLINFIKFTFVNSNLFNCPMNQFFFTFLLFVVSSFNFSFGQIDGDNIFEENQIITIEINFSQTNFWDSLENNYNTASYMKADLVLTDTTGVYSFADIGVRLKGNSSYGHPGDKKAFKIDFNEYVTGQNYDGLKKLNFSNGFKDPSFMREKLFFDLCRQVGVPAPRSNFANVYFNGIHWGFYAVIEQIDDRFLDWRILDDNGNLFKAGDNFGGGPGGGGGNEANLKHYGTNQVDYEDRYELKTNETANDWSDLIAFTDFIDNSSASTFESDLENHIEINEYISSVALDNLFSNLDSYTESARNYYIYHNLTSDKWEWIKWDGNETFGSYGGQAVSDMTMLPINFVGNNRPLLENLFNSQQLYDQYKSELCYLLENYFNSSYMDSKIDAIKNLIQSAVYADINKMYSDANFNSIIENNITVGGGPGGGVMYGLKSFIEDKNTYVSSVLNCASFTSIYNQENTNNINLYPNPTNNGITLDIEGYNGLVNVEVYDFTGKLLKTTTNTTISMQEYAKGIYLFKVAYGDRTQELKVVKE